MRSSRLLAALAMALATTGIGCFFLGNQSGPTGSSATGSGTSGNGGGSTGNGGGATGNGGSGGGTSTDKDVAQYNALKAQLDKNRKEFLTPGASGLNGFGTHLYWLDFSNGDPTLQSYGTTSSKTTNYTFSIGDTCSYNYQTSNDIIVTAENTGLGVVFHTFALDSPDTSLGDLTTNPPSNGVEWWAYSPDGGDLYYVLTEGKTTLMKWTPGQATPTMLFNLEDLGVKVGEFEDFTVASGVMVFIESGRVWSLDLTTKVPVPLGNMNESSGADVMSDGVLISTATGPFYYSNTTKMLRDISAAIAKSGYELNATFSQAHLFDNGIVTSDDLGFTSYQDLIGYIGNSGLFTFDLNKGTVAPLLLDALDNSTVYAYPVFLDDGTVFVQGLQSNDGSIGFEGPVYRLVDKL